MELFRTLGIERDVLDVADRFVPGKHWIDTDLPPQQLPRAILRARSLADIPRGDVVVMAEGENDFADIGPAEAVWCGQDKVEPILFDEAVRQGADLRFNTEFESFEQRADGITATLRDRADGEVTIVEADYLIAADGAHSAIARKLGIQRQGHGTLGHVLNILFKADLDTALAGHRFMILYLINREAPGMLFKLDHDRWIYGVFGDPKSLSPDRLSDMDCVRLVQQATGELDLTIDVQAKMGWWIGHGVTDTYRAGRIFLVGDACHVLPPTGGFGANVGVQDAGNLAWKLAAVLNGWANSSLLDTYEAERLPVGKATIDQAWMRHVRWSNPDDTTERDERDQTIITTAYRYTSSAIIGDPFDEPLGHELRIDGQPGMRVPHAWLKIDGKRVSTVDLPQHEFLFFTESSAWAEAAESAAKKFDIPLRTFDNSEISEATGTTTEGALLVRPDGFVAWRSTESAENPMAVISAVLAQITARSS
jgi:2-polyprenyl-6-methoxyphenol hydroxylase-like FAD-dependent oxidoreductase